MWSSHLGRSTFALRSSRRDGSSLRTESVPKVQCCFRQLRYITAFASETKRCCILSVLKLKLTLNLRTAGGNLTRGCHLRFRLWDRPLVLRFGFGIGSGWWLHLCLGGVVLQFVLKRRRQRTSPVF
jgi:hypothetical protein